MMPPLPKVTLDDRVWRSRVEAAERVLPFAAEEAAVAQAGVFVDAVAVLTRRDTNRLVRGWIIAGRQVGATERAVPPVQVSKRGAEIERKLTEQVERTTAIWRMWRSWQEHYQRERRTGQPYYRKITRELRKADRRRERAVEQLRLFLEADGVGVIFFDVENPTQRNQNRRLSTVRTNIHGGKGEVVRTGDAAGVALTNLEPHFWVVERNPSLGHPATAAATAAAVRGCRSG